MYLYFVSLLPNSLFSTFEFILYHYTPAYRFGRAIKFEHFAAHRFQVEFLSFSRNYLESKMQSRSLLLALLQSQQRVLNLGKLISTPVRT